MSGNHTVHRQLPRTEDAVHPQQRLLRLLRPAGRAYLQRRYEVRQHDRQHVPAYGGCIIAANHIGLLDGPLITVVAPRPVHFLAKKEMFHGRTGAGLRAIGQIPLARSEYDATAVKGCLRVLRDGGVVGIFPEGGRGDGEFQRFHHGVAYLALVTGAPIVPVTVFGTREPGGRLESLPPRDARLDLVYGEPIRLAPQPWPRRQAEVRRTSAALWNTFRDRLVEATVLTGRRLPGPVPDQAVSIPDPYPKEV